MVDPMKVRQLLPAVLSCAAVVACAARTSTPRPSASAEASVVTIEAAPEVPTRPVVVSDECYGGSSLYVLSNESTLYVLDSMLPTFRRIGTISCPNRRIDAMTIERDGSLWLTAHGGGLYRTTIEDLECGENVDRSGMFNQHGFGLAWGATSIFASDLAMGGLPSKGLWKADRSRVLGDTGSAAFIGGFTHGLQGKTADLAMDDNENLFGLFNTTPLTFAAIDKSSAATPTNTQRVLPGASAGAWALAFWHDEFWLFNAPMGSSESTIWRLPRAPHSTPTKVDQPAEFAVLGASRGPCPKAGRGKLE